MARTITELLRQTRVPTESTTQAVEDLGRVRSTGKVLEPTGPRRGDVVEEGQQADLIRQRGELLGDAAARDTLREEERKQQELQTEAQRDQFRQENMMNKQKYELASADILNNLDRNMRVMNQQEQLIALETASAAQRLANDRYQYELQDTGRRQRLETEIGMKEAINKAVWEDEFAALKDDYAFKALLEMDDTDFQKTLAAFNAQTTLLNKRRQANQSKELANADIETAKILSQINLDSMLKIAKAGAAAEALKGIIQGGVSGASMAASQYMTKSPKTEKGSDLSDYGRGIESSPPDQLPTFSSPISFA